MRRISAAKITEVVSQLCLKANIILRDDLLLALRLAYGREKNLRAKKIIDAIIQNARIALKEKLAICQDTGMPCVFIEIGQGAQIIGDLKKAVNQGIEQGYKKGSFRNSIIKDPLLRGRPVFQPAIIHTDLIPGNKIKITVLPKGFGCENKTQLKMFNPTAGVKQIKRFIIETVKTSGPDACPPYIIGVGIGGTADYACLMAKKALLRKITSYELRVTSYVSRLEKELLNEINKLNIGPMGLGGKATCLGVNIETYPTHIAGLPVAVNISCHALRSASKTIGASNS